MPAGTHSIGYPDCGGAFVGGTSSDVVPNWVHTDTRLCPTGHNEQRLTGKRGTNRCAEQCVRHVCSVQERSRLREPFFRHEEHGLTQVPHAFPLDEPLMAVSASTGSRRISVEKSPHPRAEGSVPAVHVPGQNEARSGIALLSPRSVHGGRSSRQCCTQQGTRIRTMALSEGWVKVHIGEICGGWLYLTRHKWTSEREPAPPPVPAEPPGAIGLREPLTP